jgi:6-phosphogluconolactonase (cycloisomerase 2 family)
MTKCFGQIAARTALGVAGLLAMELLTGCGNFGSGFFQNPNSPTTPASGSDYVYVVNSDSTLSAFSVGTGALTAVSGNPISPGSAYSVTVSRPDTFVYVGGAGAIYCFAIATDGALTEQTSSGISLGTDDFVSMDTSPNGDYLVALAEISGADPEIFVFSIDTSTGALTSVSSQVISPPATGTINAASVKVSPNGALVGVALGGGGDVIFPFNQSTGALSTGSTAAPQAGYEDNYLLFDPTSSYAYIGRYGQATGTGSVVTLSVTSSAALTQKSSVASGNSIKGLLLNSAGTDLYTANFSDDTISGYSATAGVLTQVTDSPFSAADGVTSLALDNSGKYVIAANSGGSGTTDVTLYEFDALNSAQLDALATYANGSGTTGSVAVAATH